MKTDPQKQRRLKSIVGGVIVALLLPLSLLIILDQFVLPYFAQSSRELSVPNVVGEQHNMAMKRLTDMRLAVMEPRKQNSESVPEGFVISQSPYAGAIVKEGRRVYLTISDGIRKVVVPDLKGKSLREIRVILLRSGITLGDIAYESSEQMPVNTVVGQGAAPGTSVGPNTPISVIISSGPPGIPVPDLLGLSRDEGRIELEAVGLHVGAISYAPSNLFQLGTIIGLRPTQGQIVPIGSSIAITVAK